MQRRWPALDQAVAALRPLVVWMSNGLELLHVLQTQLPPLLDWRTRRERGRGRGEEEPGDHGDGQEAELSGTPDTMDY